MSHRTLNNRAILNRRATITLTALLVLSAVAGASWSQEPSEEWRVERLERTWPLAESATVRVDNPLGNLWVRSHGKQEVYLLAHVQHHRDDPRELDLAASSSDEELHVEADFTQADPDFQPEAWSKRRIDLTVFVPAGAATRFSTSSGLLEVRGTRGATEVTTRTGEIKLRVHGAATARTENGDVLAQFLRTDWERPIEIATTTGAIRVEMPVGGSAEVVVETRGEITSDYSTEIDRAGDSLLKRARLSVGNDGAPMRLTSYQGPIKILQSLVPAEDDGD